MGSFKLRTHLHPTPPTPPPSGAFAATWTVDSTGPITMGLVAPLGSIPAGSGVQVGSFTTQTDVRNTWPSDGSLRYALVSVNATSTGAKVLTVIANPGGTYSPTWPSASMTFTERANNAHMRVGPILSGVGTSGTSIYYYRFSGVTAGSHESWPSVPVAIAWHTSLSGVDQVRVQGALPTGSVSYKVYGRTDPTSQLLLATGAATTPTVASLTAVGTTATLTTVAGHTLAVGDRFCLSGATQTAYNGEFIVGTVPSGTTLTFLLPPGGATSPATGSPVVCYFVYFDTGVDTPAGAFKTSTVDDPGTVWTAALPAFTSTNTRGNGAVARRAWVKVVPVNGVTLHPYLDVILEVTSYVAGGHKLSIGWQNLHNAVVDRCTNDIATTVNGSNVSALTVTGFTTYVGQRWGRTTYTGMTEAVVHHDFEPWIAANVIPRIPPTVDPRTYDLTTTNYKLGCGLVNGRFYVGEAIGGQGDSENADRQELNMWCDWEARLFALNTEAYRLAVIANGEAAGCWTQAIDAAGDGQTPLTDQTKFTDDTAGYRNDSGVNWVAFGQNYTEDSWWRGTAPAGVRLDGEHLVEMVFVPYLLTGDKFHLDQVRFQGGWASIYAGGNYADGHPIQAGYTWPGYHRGRHLGGETNWEEMGRNFGRPLKKIARAAWACEDSDTTFQTYLHTITQNNLKSVDDLTNYLATSGWGDGGSWAHFYPNFAGNGDLVRYNSVVSTTGANPTVLTVIGDNSGIGTGTNDHAMATGDYVTLSGFSGGAAGLNGLFPITKIDALTFSVAIDTTGSATSGVGAWSTPRGHMVPPWRLSDGAREVAWIGFTGLWTMLASTWAFPDRCAQMAMAFQDYPNHDTHPGGAYGYYPCVALISGNGRYNFPANWTAYEAMNNGASSTAALISAQAEYTQFGMPEHRGSITWPLGSGTPDENYTPYMYVMLNYAYLRGIPGALAARARLEAATRVLPELKRRAGFYQKST